MTSPDAKFRFTQEETVSTLELLPELNHVPWGEIDSLGTQVLESLETRKNPNVIVDLSPLNYMGSAMVALIVRVWKATLAKKGKLSVVCPNAGVKEVLSLASLDKHWAITETVDEARAAVGAARRQVTTVGSEEVLNTSSRFTWIAIPLVLILGIGIGVYVAAPSAPAASPSEEAATSSAESDNAEQTKAEPATEAATNKETPKPQTPAIAEEPPQS